MERSWIQRAFVSTVGAMALAGSAAASVFLQLNPAATYLRTNSDPAPPAVAYELATLGVAPGDRIELRRMGLWDNGPAGDQFSTLIGIFSGSSTLLANNELHRVPDAVAAGVPVVMGPTYFGNLPTDIPEDFVISTAAYPSGVVCVTVPPGATHVFFSVMDSLYYDNVDPNADWGVMVTLLDPCAADIDGNGVVDGADLGLLLFNWGALTEIGGTGDLNCNGIVDGGDLGLLLTAWGECR